MRELPPIESSALVLNYLKLDHKPDKKERIEIARLLSSDLVQYSENVDPLSLLQKRTHHSRTDDYLISFMIQNAVLPHPKTDLPGFKNFIENGMSPGRDLHFWLLYDKLKYFDDKHRISDPGQNYMRSDGTELIYSQDLRGKTPQEVLSWIMGSAKENLLIFRKHGNAPVELVTVPDGKCHACVQGEHCHIGMISSIEGNMITRQDAWLNRQYIEEYERNPDGWYAQPQVIERQTVYSTKPETHGEEKKIVTVVATNMADYRRMVEYLVQKQMEHDKLHTPRVK